MSTWAKYHDHHSPGSLLFQSSTDDPFFNLACEEWLLRTRAPGQTILFIFRNSPSVIIGRNQNPWQECALVRLEQENIPVVRRCSGGGTVYHDLGNCNFTLIGDRQDYHPQRHLELALQALDRLGIDARIKARRDLFHGDRKISGSAYSLTGKNSLQHGTMLVNSDLAQLRAALVPNPLIEANIASRAVSSIRSSVINLADIITGLTPEQFELALTSVFKTHHGHRATNDYRLSPEPLSAVPPELSRYLVKYRNREWLIGRTPSFTLTWQSSGTNGRLNCQLQTSQGRIRQVSIESDQNTGGPAWATSLANCLAGVEFWPDTLRNRLSDAVAQEQSPRNRQEIIGFTQSLLAPA